MAIKLDMKKFITDYNAFRNALYILVFLRNGRIRWWNVLQPLDFCYCK